MICNCKLRSKNHLEFLLFALLSLVYLYLCFPFFPFHISEYPDPKSDSARQIFRFIEKDDRLEDGKHLLIIPFSKILIYANVSKDEKAVDSFHWIELKQLPSTPRPPPISS